MPSFPADGDYRITVHDACTGADILLPVTHSVGLLTGPSEGRPYTTIERELGRDALHVRESIAEISSLVAKCEYDLTHQCFTDITEYYRSLETYAQEFLFGVYCELWELNPDVMCNCYAGGTLLCQVMRSRAIEAPAEIRLDIAPVLELLRRNRA